MDTTFLHIFAKMQPTATSTHMLVPNMCQKLIQPSNLAYILYMPNIWCAYLGAVCEHIWGMNIINVVPYRVVQTHGHTNWKRYRWEMVIAMGWIWYPRSAKRLKNGPKWLHWSDLHNKRIHHRIIYHHTYLPKLESCP